MNLGVISIQFKSKPLPMSLFLNTSSLHNNYLDGSALNISETIEHDCLSVLHKLHDQVNGLQLVQVVVQPLAKLFNPANLAALATSSSSLTQQQQQQPLGGNNSGGITSYQSNSNATTPLSQHSSSGHDPEGPFGSTSAAAVNSSSTSSTLNVSANSNPTSHSKGSSFVSTYNVSNTSTNQTVQQNSQRNNPVLSTTSTYMMSPDTAQALIARLDTDRDVNWLMEIIGYGLSMPFSLSGGQDSVKDCCTIYCEWLSSALVPYNEQDEDSKYHQLSKLVPVPIRKEPNRYARKMLSHLYNVFLPRPPIATPTQSASSSGSHKDQQNASSTSDSILTAVSRQAVLCHRVLRTIESIAQNPQNLMDNSTWEHLLTLLLTVNDKLLSAPTEMDDIGTQLHDRILGVLFEIMLLASAKSIPSANMWKTFHEMCLNWRHRPALVDHWRRITLALTRKIVFIASQASSSSPIVSLRGGASGGDCEGQRSQEPIRPTTICANTTSVGGNNSGVPSSAIEVSINSMSHENLSQTWYRFLNLIGNPVELADPEAISRTDEFYHLACASDNVLDPRQHPCLNVLPQSFLNSMLTLRDLIDTFLGYYDLPRDSHQVSNSGTNNNNNNSDRSSSLTGVIGESQQEQQQQLLHTPDRGSYNQSSRGSISSLSGLGINLSNLTSTATNSQQHQQSQATTPTLSRRSAIKSLTIKSGKGGSSSSSAQQVGSTQQQQLDGSPIIYEHSKTGSISNSSRTQSAQQQQIQLNQPRPSLTSLTSRLNQPLDSQSGGGKFKFYADRPKCNSILHVFGDWLFSAALIGSELNGEIAPALSELGEASDRFSGGESITSSLSTTTEIGTTGDNNVSRSASPSLRRTSNQTISSQNSTSRIGRQINNQQLDQLNDKMTLDSPLSPESFESGQAEAMAILCKIFSSKSSSEDISPSYVSRFYLCLQHCLTFGTGQDQRSQTSGMSLIKRQLLASVLVNSTKLLQKDLDGINLLIPSLIKAIEFVFECSEKELPVQPPPRQNNRSSLASRQTANTANLTASQVTNYELRRACIMTLVNLLAYPLHFQDLVIRNCLNDSAPTTTFGLLRPRLLKLLFVALQTETDPTNMQVLFGGLSLAIHDLSSTTTKNLNQTYKSQRNRHKSDSQKSSTSHQSEDSTHNSIDTHSTGGGMRQQDGDTISQNSFVFNSTSGFLIKSLHVTCHLLINIWKHDTQVSLAALEVLTTIARVSTSPTFIEGNNNNNNNQHQPTGHTIRSDASRASSLSNHPSSSIEMRNEYMQTSKWICDYICNQCSRPPPAHSRDMHSTIVAAYQCLSVWFYNHPYLLSDENCIDTLMEVIELGVSGQKSKSANNNNNNNNPSTIDQEAQNLRKILKGNKIMKPSSMRVRDAAESLLNICMIRDVTSRETNTFGSPSSSDTMVDELDLVELFGGARSKASIRQIQDQEMKHLEACKSFKYFSDEDSLIFGFLEGLNHESSSKDSVICLLRTPFGKHCWRMRFNYYTEKSKDKIIANKTLGLIKRPFHCTTPLTETRMNFNFSTTGPNKSLYFNNTAKFFPETLENVPASDLDQLVSSLDDYMSQTNDLKLKNDLEKISRMFSHQIMAEQKVINECSVRIKRIECEEPQQLNELETARIIATHLGLKTSLTFLNQNEQRMSSLLKDLRQLDKQSIRTSDSVSIFYVRKNKTTPKEILESVRARHNISLSFFEWLLELGEPTIVKNHSRWTGRLSNSWTNKPAYRPPQNNHLSQRSNQNSQLEYQQQTLASSMSRNQMLASDHGGAIFDGERMSLYWSDMCQELAFLVPHKIERQQPVTSGIQIGDTNIIICWLECHDDIQQLPSDILLAISETGYLIDHQEPSSLQQQHNQKHNCDNIVLAPNDEVFEHHHNNNSQTITSTTTATSHSTTTSNNEQHLQALNKPKLRDNVRYIISPIKNGLYRVNLTTSFGCQWFALPLIDGMTVSKGILSNLIRESVLNLCRRRRLDADSYQPAHVKRRLKIQEICNSYKISSRHESTDFYYNLFKSKLSN